MTVPNFSGKFSNRNSQSFLFQSGSSPDKYNTQLFNFQASLTSDEKLSLNCTEEVRFIENPSSYWNTTLGVTV